jgi:hypothetical protein
MLPETEHRKILVQTRDKIIENEFIPFAFQFLMGPSVSSGQAQ